MKASIKDGDGPTAIAEWIIFGIAAVFAVAIFFFVMIVVGFL